MGRRGDKEVAAYECWNQAQSLSEANATTVALGNPAPARMLSSA